jgi:hypothetical protein
VYQIDTRRLKDCNPDSLHLITSFTLMAIKFNSAYRVCATLRAMSERESGSTVEQWAKVFGIIEADRGMLSVTVARLIGLLREQIDMVETQLMSSDYSETTYTAQMASARAIATAENLIGDWAPLRAKLTPDVIHTFLIFADTLPVNETQLAKDELDEFTRIYKQTTNQVDDAYMPRPVKNFLREQLKMIANGVREYHVQGMRAFQRASVECAINAVTRPAEVDGYKDTEAVRGITMLLKKIKQYGSMDLQTEQILELDEEISETVGDPWPGWAWYEKARA